MSDLKVKVSRPAKDEIDLQSLSKEELIARVNQLQAHVVQLRNLLKTDSTSKNKCHTGRPFDHKRYARRHVLLHVSYVGWDYMGYVVQEQTQKTIEAEIFKALEKTCLIESRETSNYNRCGRTDKGVSSFGQVISIDLRSNLDNGPGVFVPPGHELKPRTSESRREIQYAHVLNKVLPTEIRVVGWAPVEQSFSARFDCKQRTYHYYFPRGDLNIEDMRKASHYLIGTHDFRNLCKMDVGNGVVQFIRSVTSISIEPVGTDNDSYSMQRITLVGQAFLWHQVRSIVAVLFLVGQGKEEPTIMVDLLDVEKNPRKPQYTMASELPLNLFHCAFADVDDWVYDQDALCYVIRDYQTLWTEHSVKSVMLKEMLQNLEQKASVQPERPYLSLIQGVEAKVYTPLLKRPQCESLERRIEHYAKRKRIEIVTEETESAGS